MEIKQSKGDHHLEKNVFGMFFRFSAWGIPPNYLTTNEELPIIRSKGGSAQQRYFTNTLAPQKQQKHSRLNHRQLRENSLTS